MDDTVPESGLQKFKNSKIAYPIGMIIGILVGIGLFYMGIYTMFCGLGMVLISASMFIIIRFFNGKTLKKMIAFGLVFFVVVTLFGAFVVSAQVIDGNTDTDGYNSEKFSEVTITYSGENRITSVAVKYDGTLESGQSVYFHMGKMTYICYKGYGIYTKSDTEGNSGKDILLTEDSGVYRSGEISVDMDGGSIYGYYFKVMQGDDQKVQSAPVFHKVNISGSEQIQFMIIWNGYYTVMILGLYLIIVFFSYRAGKKLENVRAEMEADGRLYPKGYGRCKQCGTVVLPGETNCRKCGAFIEVPEEFQKKQVEYCECSECGAHIPADSDFCPKCGAKFDEEDETVIVVDGKVEDVKEEKKE